MTYTVKIIHPTPAADFALSVLANSAAQARSIAYRCINDKYGANTLYMVGHIEAA